MSANTAVEMDPATAGAETDDVRQRILEIAIHRFANRGYSETSTREIVEAAGCTKPTLYYHFQNKAGLFRAAVELAHHRVDGPDDEEPEDAPVRELLLASLDRVAQHIKAYPDDLRLLFRADSYSNLGSDLVDMRSLCDGHIAMASAALQAGIETGEVRKDLPVEDAAISLIGTLHLHLQMALDGRPLHADFAARIVSVYMDGVSR